MGVDLTAQVVDKPFAYSRTEIPTHQAKCGIAGFRIGVAPVDPDQRRAEIESRGPLKPKSARLQVPFALRRIELNFRLFYVHT
jgi:hypothetical protein